MDLQSPYSRTYEIIWANLDPNMHLRHTAYNDYAAQTRLSYFIEFGLSVAKIQKAGIGPILFREDTRFLKEVKMGESIRVDCVVNGLRKDGSRWNIFHHIWRSDQEIAATIQVEGAWIDISRRKLAIPDEEVRDIMFSFPQSQDFQWLPDSKSKI